MEPWVCFLKNYNKQLQKMEIIYRSKLIEAREMEPLVCFRKKQQHVTQKIKIVFCSKLIEGREIEPWVCFRKNYNMYNYKNPDFNGI